MRRIRHSERRARAGRGRVTAAGVLISALLVAASGASAQTDADDTEQEQAPTVEPARQVTPDTNPVRLYLGQDLAVHPDDPSTLALGVAEARDGGCALAVSRDGGLSWSVTKRNVLPAAYEFCVQTQTYGPVVALDFAPNGELYMGLSGVAQDQYPEGATAVLTSHTDNLGRTTTFSTVAEGDTDVTRDTGEGDEQVGDEQLYRNSLAVHPDDSEVIYRGWRSMLVAPDAGVWGPRQAYVARSADGGSSWSEPVDLLAATDRDSYAMTYPALDVSNDGTVHAFTFEWPDNPMQDDAAPGQLVMLRSQDRGETWTRQVIAEDAGRASFSSTPVVAREPDTDNLYVAWETSDSDDVQLAASRDGGQTWQDPVAVNDDPAEGNYKQYQPGLSVAPNGRIDLAWHDFRNDPTHEFGEEDQRGPPREFGKSDIYYTYSTDGGQTWAPNLKVNDRALDAEIGVSFDTNNLRNPLAVASTDAQALLAWPDSRAGTAEHQAQDTYFTRVRHQAPAENPGSGGAPLLASVLGAGAALAGAGAILLTVTRRVRRT